MTIRCPQCQGEAKLKPRDPGQFLAWCLASFLTRHGVSRILYRLAEKSQFQCVACGRIFFSHTTSSLVVSILLVVGLTLLIGMMVIAVWTGLRS